MVKRTPHESLTAARDRSGDRSRRPVDSPADRPADVIGTPGRRRPDGTEAHELEPGDYARDNHGVWVVRPPAGPDGRSAAGSLGKHTVTEHEDGTITVEPSVLQEFSDGDVLFHGFLRRGIWTTV